MVPVFRVGPSDLSTAQAPGTHRGNAAYRLLVRGELLWPGRCNAVRSRPPPGEATCPARCDHKASRPDAATARLALRLTILPPSLPPNATGHRLGSRSRVRAKEPVRQAMVEIFPLGWNCPASARQRHTGSDLGFCLRVKRRTFSLDRKRSSDWQAKNPPDLRSPLTESNRRPSPYHGDALPTELRGQVFSCLTWDFHATWRSLRPCTAVVQRSYLAPETSHPPRALESLPHPCGRGVSPWRRRTSPWPRSTDADDGRHNEAVVNLLARGDGFWVGMGHEPRVGYPGRPASSARLRPARAPDCEALAERPHHWAI